MNYVLLVDDDICFLNMLAIALSKSFGIEVVLALDGEEALAIIEKRKPSLIFLDLMMPGFGGVEVMKRLAESEETRSIPVYVITALFDSAAAVSLKGMANLRGIFGKPLRMATFISLVRQSEFLGWPSAGQRP